MDKELPLSLVLAVFLIGGTIGFLASRKWRWLAFIFSPLFALLGAVQLMELWDPYVGPAIREEAGSAYFVWSYISIISGIVLPIIGALIRKKTPEKEEARQGI